MEPTNRFEQLASILHDEDAPLERRCDACREMSALSDPRCDAMLAALRTKPPQALRMELVYSLGQLRDGRAFEPFCEIIRDRSNPPLLRGFAAELITRFEGSDVVPVLLEALAAPEPMVRFDAAWSLASHGDERARAALLELVDAPEKPYGDEESIGDVVERALARLDLEVAKGR